MSNSLVGPATEMLQWTNADSGLFACIQPQHASQLCVSKRTKHATDKKHIMHLLLIIEGMRAAVGSRVKYLVDTSELLWGCLDTQDYLEAAHRYLSSNSALSACLSPVQGMYACSHLTAVLTNSSSFHGHEQMPFPIPCDYPQVSGGRPLQPLITV